MTITSRVLGMAARGTRSSASRPACENFEDNINPEDMAQAQQIQIESQTAMEELDQAQAEMDELAPEGEILTEAVSTYPEVVDMIKEDIDNNGGVSTESAKYLNFILDRMGIASLVNVSVENFGDNSRRLGASKVSVEGIRETLRNWWESLLAWFTKMRKKLKTWWIKNFSTASALQKRAQNLQERAQAITKGQPKEKKLSFSNLQSSLFMDGKMPSANDLRSGLESMSVLGEKIFNDWQKNAIASADKILEVSGNADLDSSQGINQFATSMAAAVQELTVTDSVFHAASGDKIPERFRADKLQASYTCTVTNELPGQKALYLIQLSPGKPAPRVKAAKGNAAAGAEGAAAGAEGEAKPANDVQKQNAIDELATAVSVLTTRNFSLSDSVAKPKENAETQIDTWQPTNIIELCSVVENFARIIEGYQRNFAAQEKANDNIDKFKKTVDKVGDEDNTVEAAKVANLIKRIPSTLFNLINEPATKYSGHFFTVANAVLKVSERSLAQY